MRKTRVFSLAALALAVLLLSGFGCAENNDDSGMTVEEVEGSSVPGIEIEMGSVDSAAAEAVSSDERSGEYTLEDVANHATADDCWMAIDGQVYDLSGAVENHPGGEALLKGCGQEASQLFATKGRGEAGPPHSPQAQEGLANYLIGTLK